MNTTIILAAGHGGGDSGATGQGTTEAAECIQIVNRAADKLRADGRFEVVVVPHELNLIDEINWINARYKNLEDGICLEIHKNATVNGHGIEAWFYSGDSKSQAIAQDLLDGIMSVPGMPVSRGVHGDATNRWGSLGWIRETNPWAILLEMGFVSDGGDPVDDTADNIYAEGIYKGVLNLFAYDAPQASPPAPAPAPVKIAFRVYNNEKQIGAYNSEANAWAKFRDAGGVRITNSDGKDVTATFVAKYRPTVPTPQPTTPPEQSHPVYDPAKDAEQDKRLSDIEKAVQAIKDFLANFKWWGK
jgi:hypothetical protein